MKEPKVNLTIVDKYGPEVTAMLQSYYSRSHLPIQERLNMMGDDEESIKESLKKWYINYGHKSIGQCGHTTIYIEGVSILAAKSYQDTQLYFGQETSTRFINFAEQAMHNPCNDTTGIQQDWINFYIEAQEPTIRHVATQQNLDLTDPKHYAAAKARTFDILRAFVPAGASTQLSWHTNFTHAADRLVQLCQHPASEISAVSRAMSSFLQNKYKFAFADFDQTIAKFEQYHRDNGRGLNYLLASDVELEHWPEFQHITFEPKTMRTLDGVQRQRGTPVPRHLSYQGRYEFKYKLDFGSFRDIQRHRPCTQMLPILTTRYGFHQWYLNSLPESLRAKAITLIALQTERINALYEHHSDVEVQYYIPLGFIVHGLLDCDYPQATYIAEIRSSKFVHPTLRKLAVQIAKVVDNCGLSNNFVEWDEDDFTIKRGQQDIIKRG